ncbi:hypothetical protein O0L34_g1642 [Tuta absoluta]|nr:hypothetical protein O0L34_g1642 [Tuta absoluta]
MANDNKEIGDIVKKCKILLLDIEGTTTSISFVKDKLFPYAEENVKQFLDSQWESDAVKDVVVALRKLSVEDKEGSVEGVVVIPGEDATKEDQIEGLVNNVKWQMSSDRKAGPLKQLQGLIWKQGYDNGDIKGHVYDDVSAALEAWHSADGQKVYIYSSGSVQAQKMLFGQSSAGDLLKFIDGHFDTAVGAKQEAASYTNIVEKIGCKADEILFLTDIVKEAEAARTAGLHAALVSREGNAPLPAEAAAAFPVLHSLAGLTVSNKRKPDPQEEVPAAKILKTDVENDVKTTETEKLEEVAKETAEAAKMEVEETATPPEEIKPVVKEQVIVEELNSNDATSVTSVIDVEPATVEMPKDEEKDAKTDEKETEKETPEESKPTEPPAKTEPVVVMEVEEVTDKPIPDVAQIIEDVVPIVEEPDNQEEMEELKNVGDVLEKECDDILAKVNDVTNLENITIKPMLNSIAEETMETDNTDSNDIVDRILDTELDLEMKNDVIDPSAVTEMAEEPKTEVDEKKSIQEENTVIDEVKKDVEKEEIVTEKKEEKEVTDTKKNEATTEKKETEEIVTESSPVETEGKDTKVDDAQTKESQVDVSSTEAEKPVQTKESETTDTIPAEVKPAEVEAAQETTPAQPEEAPSTDKPTETAPEVSKIEEEPQLNGTAANGDAKPTNGDAKPTNGDAKPTNGDVKDAAMNGDASKDDLSARLADDTVENGKVNGANGDSVEEHGQGDCKVDDIKVKSVSKDEPRGDPIEQPTEA